jgi:hypothetical protein
MSDGDDFNNKSRRIHGDDDAYEYTYHPNEDNGQEAELETVKTSTTINTKRTSPHNNKFRLMTISQRNIREDKDSDNDDSEPTDAEIDESTFRAPWSNKEIPLSAISGYKKLEVVVDVSGDKADDDKKSDETTVDDKPKEDTKCWRTSLWRIYQF